MTDDVLERLAAYRREREACALATVVEVTGSSSAGPGAKALIDAEGRVVAGWVGGGCAESSTCEVALACLDSGESTVIDLDMNDEVLGTGMPCGGSMRVYVEPMLPAPRLWLLGHGRLAEVLSRLAALQGLDVVAIDPLASGERFPDAVRCIADDHAYRELTPEATDFVVVATQHRGDHRAMQVALASPARYIALIASRRRARLVLDYLRQEGAAEAELARVRSPAGLDLGARTPEEIALSIVAEMVMVRRGGAGGVLTESPASAAGRAVDAG